QYGFKEIIAEFSIDPGGAKDDMARRRRAHGRFPSRLGATIDAERRDRVAFDIRAWLLAVEHVISRDMDQRSLPRRAGGRDDTGPDFIPALCGVDFYFRQVHLGVGGGIYDERRPDLAQGAGDGAGVRYVDLCAR